jgi:hypothetical protein
MTNTEIVPREREREPADRVRWLMPRCPMSFWPGRRATGSSCSARTDC